MDRREEIGFQLHRLSRLTKRLVDRETHAQGEDQISGIQGWIIGYLYENQGKDVFQRDLQAHFSVRRSTVTGLLQLMEKKGLITRSSVAQDARLKKIQLTPRAIQHHERIVTSIQSVENRISQGLTPQERKTFLSLCEKIAQNLEGEQ